MSCWETITGQTCVLKYVYLQHRTGLWFVRVCARVIRTASVRVGKLLVSDHQRSSLRMQSVRAPVPWGWSERVIGITKGVFIREDVSVLCDDKLHRALGASSSEAVVIDLSTGTRRSTGGPSPPPPPRVHPSHPAAVSSLSCVAER